MTASRAALDADQLAPRLPAGWTLRTVAETGSTNADLLALAATGGADRSVLVAEAQTAGRGRLDRSWLSPVGAGLTVSVLVRPTTPTQTWGWLPLLAGLALAEVVDADLKWPNDVLLGRDGHKLAGILAQSSQSAGAVVLGLGVNVSTTEAELPVSTATSLTLQGHPLTDRAELLVRLIAALDAELARWQQGDGDAVACGLATAYRARCVTIGSEIRVEQPSGPLSGRAVAVDDAGRLLVQSAAGGEPVAVSAGDVTHVRPRTR